MFSTTLALAVILTGHDTEPPCPREALYAVAIDLELMDERELKWWGKPWTGFEATDVQLLHERYTWLHDAPPACDAARWPDRDVCSCVIAFNLKYIKFLEQRSTIFHDPWIDDALDDARWTAEVYRRVIDCTCPYYYITARRAALKHLRNIIGSWDYYSGTLPPVAPVWHFQRVD